MAGASQARAREEGLPALYEELRRVDPQRAGGSPSAMKSASSGLWRSGTRPGDHHRPRPPDRPASLQVPRPADRPGLRPAPRPVGAHRRPGGRDDGPGAGGEVRRLLSAGVPEGCTAMQAIGYKEFAAALRGRSPCPTRWRR
ncbi:MAG: hypothetical protein ACLSAF_04230 [Intestinimonas sp.]